MENILSLAWFYTKNAPWNPYYACDALRLRLEAALLFWCDMQNDDGAFSEYATERWNLASTAFATKFIGETMALLKDGPPIDSLIFQKMRDSIRRAILRVFRSRSWWEHGRSFTNQYTNAFAGALVYLDLYEDEKMEERLEDRMRAAADDFISTAGYMFEADGPDWGYYFGTHHSNVQMIWHYGRDRKLSRDETEVDWKTYGDIQKEEYERTTEWLSYNAVPHPEGKFFYLNRAIETRQSRWAFVPLDKGRYSVPLAEVVPRVRAFLMSEAEQLQSLEECRKKLEKNWGDPPSLRTGTFWGFSPYEFLHREHTTWYPTEDQRQEAKEQKLPYLAEDRFVHQRMDDRKNQVFTYIRRPGYYVAFNDTTLTSPRGVGLVWHPDYGAVFQSQQDERFSWKARCLDQESHPERRQMVDYRVDGDSMEIRPGTRDFPDGEFEISSYIQGGKRKLQFNDKDIQVALSDFSANFVEQLPLLLGEEDELDVNEEEQIVQLTRENESVLTIEFDGAGDIKLNEGEKKE